MIKKLAVPARMGKVFASAFLALAFFISFHVDVFAAEVMLDSSTVSWFDAPHGKIQYTRTLYAPDKVGVYAKNEDYYDTTTIWVDLYRAVGDTLHYTGYTWALDNYTYTNQRLPVPDGPGYYVLKVRCYVSYGDGCNVTVTLSSWDVQ